MKLQNLTVIFIIIVLPVILLLSLYISSSIKTVKFQASYDEALLTAAHDAVYAFEKNSANEDLAKNPEVKRTLVKSSIEMFETSLANSYGISNYSSEEVQEYVPAVVFGMHDGFYLYSPSGLYDSTSGNVEDYEHNLKNYVYYSETVNLSGDEITIMYSLDNYVTVCGNLNDEYGNKYYQIRKGYLSVLDDSDPIGEGYQNIDIISETIDGELQPNTKGIEYFNGAYNFTHWWINNSGLASKTIGGVRPFDISPTNDPEDEKSAFVQHKREVIKEKIEGVLNSTITAYSKRIWSKNYKMPKLREEEWEKIYSNISMIGFFQGKEMGLTEYNGYCVVNSTNSKEYVNPNLMYFINKDATPKTYHDIRCTTISSIPADKLTGYRIGNFESKTEIIEQNKLDAHGNPVLDPVTGLPQKESVKQPTYEYDALACYECINASLDSNITLYDFIKPNGGTADPNLKTAYWTSLGRERADANEITPTTSAVQIRFDANHGTEINPGYLSPYCTTYSPGDPISFPLNPSTELDRNGYTFSGWSKSPTATSGIPGTEGGIGEPTTTERAMFNTTYYAVWIPNEYPVTFIWNADIDQDGDVDNDDKVVKMHAYGLSVPFTREHADKNPGKSFIGWSKDGTNVISDEMSCKVLVVNDPSVNTSNTYYAVWDNITYTIKFMMNDGTGAEYNTQTKLWGESIDIPADPTRTGYQFMGWSMLDGSFESADPILNDPVDGSKTFHAYWGHKITFDYNDGTGNKQEKVFEQGQVIDFPTTPSRTGYKFVGWYTDNTLTTPVPAGITATSNATYYAGWEIEEYTIKFDAYGGSEITAGYLEQYNRPNATKPKYKYGETIEFPADPKNNLEKYGYKFNGWSTTQGETSGIMHPSAVATANVTYYACWSIKQYNIEFSLDGGTGVNLSTYNQPYNHGAIIAFPTTNPTKDYHTFDGWKRDDGTDVIDTTNEQAVRNITFIAKWKPQVYNITFEPQNGEAPWTEQHAYNSVVNFNNTITKTGHKLIGWNTNSSATTGEWSAVVTGDATYYAIWKVEPYTITFHLHNDDGDVIVTNQDYGDNIDVPPEPHGTKKGHSFAGWKKNNTGSILTTANIEATTVPAEDVAYHAQWTANQYEVKFYYNDGSSPETVIQNNQTYGTNVTFPADPTRTGYTFDGWSTVRNGSRITTTPQVSEDESKNIFYARWKINKYKITFQYNGGKDGAGSTGPKVIEKNYGTSLNGEVPTVSRAGYKFEGWKENNAGNNLTKAEVEAKTVPASHVSYHAQWSVGIYKITCDKQNGTGGTNEFYEKYSVGYYSNSSATSSINAISVPTRAGYIFGGYYTQTNGRGDQIVNASGNIVAANTKFTNHATIYAAWTLIPAPSFDEDSMTIRTSVSIGTFGARRCY